MKALVTAEFTADGVRRLEALGYRVMRAGWGVTHQPLARQDLVAAAAGVQLLLTEIETVDRPVLDALPDLALVGTARGGPANVDLTACAERGLPVLFTPGRNAESVADFTIGLLLALLRQIPAADRHLRAHGWLVGDELPYLHFRGPELGALTLGLIGYGAVGTRVAKRARDGFGMAVCFTDPAVEGSVPLPDLLSSVDVLSLHCPRLPETHHLIDGAALSRLRPGSYLVNTAGGAVVDPVALRAALDSGHLAGAALDVYEREPLPADDPLLGAPRLLLTPHLAGAATDVVRHHTELLCDDVERWHRGEPLRHQAKASAAR